MGKTEPVEVVRKLLHGYSAEVTTPDRRALDSAARMMPKNAPVYVAALPKDTAKSQLEVACSLSQLGLRPVPHIVARNIEDRRAFECIVRDLALKARVDRALILGGDRDDPAGSYDSSLQLLQSGILEEYGITRVAVGCYPEGHPRISNAVLERALFDKIEVSEKVGFDIRLISQLCFDADAIVGYLRSLRQRGVRTKFRVGVAGPAKTTTLLKYAAICGVGPSLKALKNRQNIAKGLITNQNPAKLIRQLAEASQRDSSLDITGIHFFTFSSLKKTIEWAEKELAAG